MRILRVHVPDYGPLRGLELEPAPGLNVVYGGNETGKTTLLDFLLAHLFRWEKRTGTRLSTVLDGLDRFGDADETAGGLELRLGGEVVSYPDRGPSLLHHLGLEHAGLAGLFCVRSGELDLPEQEAGDFWRELKKVLSGLPEGVEALKERAHEAAGLTPSGEMLLDRAPDKLRTRRDELDGRIDRLEELAGRLDEVSEAAGEVSRLERRRERLERARVARVAELSGRLEEARSAAAETEAPAGEDLQRWERARSERDRLERELEGRREALQEARQELEEKREEHREAEREAARLQERLERVRERGLEERARRLEEDAAPDSSGRWADVAYWAGTALLALGIGFTFFTPSDVLGEPAWLLAVGLALAAGGLLHWAGRRGRGRREELEEGRADLAEDAAACGLEAEAPGDVPARVRALEERVGEAGQALTAARERARAAEERREERAGEVERLEGELEEARDQLEALREESGFEALEEARRARQRVEDLEDRADQLEAALRELAGPDPSDWRAEPPDDADRLPDWSSEEKREVDERLRGLEEERRELERAFDQAGLDAPEDVLPRLQELRAERAEIDRDAEAGRLAGEVFATMGEALESRLAEALEREGPHSVGGLVRRITGSYERVERDEDDGLAVRDGEGRSWPLHRLSRGTRDQVYLALRLGLARSALEAAELGEPGFFLLDDAFLTADWARRERLVEATAGLADDGWQVVYLTCDDHLRDLFVEAGAALHEL